MQGDGGRSGEKAPGEYIGVVELTVLVWRRGKRTKGGGGGGLDCCYCSFPRLLRP